MTAKEKWIFSLFGMLVGVLSGVVGAAYSWGADKQHIKDNIRTNQIQITKLTSQTEQLCQLLATQLSNVQKSINNIDRTVTELRGEIKVLEAIVTRIEDQIKSLPPG